jgi:xylulokinase
VTRTITGSATGPFFVGHDLGTGGDKAVLTDAHGGILAEAFHPYPLDHPQPGWAEQDPEHYWEAVCATTREVLTVAGVEASQVSGVGFGAQMLTMVPVDDTGRPTHRAISWLDARAVDEARALTRRLGGDRIVRKVAGAVPSAKDVIAKWAWLRAHVPEAWAATVALTDATGFLVARATGVVCADHTAGGGTGMIDRRKRTWSRPLLVATGMGAAGDRAKLPELRPCTDVVGGLLAGPASELGLVEGTLVVAGVGDVPAAQVGSGAVRPGQAHVCLGTSGWLCVTTDRVADLPAHGVFSLPAPRLGTYATVGEMETAGECLDWLAAVLGGPGEPVDVGTLIDMATAAPAGCEGLVFAPWLFGERSPVSDADLRGTWLGLSLGHTRAHLVRAVLEGVAHNLRWVLEVMARKGMDPARLRVIGGGARSELWMQVLADVTGLGVDTLDHPQFAGARGSALLAAVGTGALPDIDAVADLPTVAASFEPDLSVAGVHARNHVAFREALSASRAHARALRT